MSHSADGWATHALTDQERDSLRDFATTVGSDPYHDLGASIDEATNAWSAFTEETRHRVASLADGTSHRPELHITNLPTIKDLPPTPSATHSWARLTRACTGEAIMLAFMTGLGHPISYLDQRDGSIFHDIYPTRTNAAQVSSQSSSVDLGHHTEMFFHPKPPDFLMLHCLRSMPERHAYTSVSAVCDIEAALSSGDRDLLGEPLFAVDLARLHGRYTNDGSAYTTADPRPRIPIVSSTAVGRRFRFEPALMTPTTAPAGHAMRRADHAADRVAVHDVLREGGVLIVDNRRAAHSRSRFSAHFDGADRWLRRVMIGTATAAASAPIQRHDLELAHAWRATGAIVEPISYVHPSRGE